MDGFDLVAALVGLGVDEKSAEDLKTRLKGSDLINLVNALNTENIGSGVQNAEAILRKYNVNMGGSKPVNDYESAQNEALKSGKLFAVEEFINEWLTPVSINEHSLLGEGFNYAVEVNEQHMDRVLDWLDENQVEYQAGSPNMFHVKCGDRAAAYKVSRALSEIMSKAVVRDSNDNEVEPMSEKKMSVNKRISKAKEKMAKLTPKDPNRDAATFRNGAGVHKDGKDKRKADSHGRDVKHKGRRFYEASEFSIGDSVMVGEQQGTIKIPHGPNGTIGVILDGELAMVAESDVNRLDEGVIGMTNMNPLFRLRELAGMAPAPMMGPEDVLSDPEDLAVGSGTDVADLPADDLGALDGMDDMDGMDMPAPVASDPAVDDLGAIDPDSDDMGLDPLDAPANMSVDMPAADAGVPGDLPPMPVEPALGVAVPAASEAMSMIEDSLNAIQTQLADIRLGEYKTLVKKLQDLTNQVQVMGRDYLGERRKK